MGNKNNTFVKYKDLLTINKFNEETNNEKFVYLPIKDDLVIGIYQANKNMLDYGEKIAVRYTVYEKLKKAAIRLKEYNKNYKLIVVFGFRDMKLQEKYFYEIYESVKDNFTNELDMYEYIHEKIAVPEVAGHPTGGAVDIAIYDEKEEKIIEFGSKILDWDTTKCYYYSDDIPKEAIDNRKLLRKIMMEEEFAPYDGEWWHFSYGDREWAFYYKKEEALYKQVNAEEVFKKEQNDNSNFFQVEYIKFIPGGNDTALVLAKNYTTEEKKAINDVILGYDKSIEQVGFVDAEQLPELQMAGGEFCGNATRSAAYYYLKGKAGTIKVLVNGHDEIYTGVYESGEAWCEIPLYHGDDVIVEKETGIYQVRMNGMVSIVIREDIAKQYLQEKNKLKEFAVQFIDKYELRENEAVGVMFLERTDKLKIHPVVWVRSINTLYYETGCGSGTTATAMVEAFLKNENQKLKIVQPSGLAITAEITIENKHIIKAVISGKVNTDNKVVKVNVLKVETAVSPTKN